MSGFFKPVYKHSHAAVLRPASAAGCAGAGAALSTLVANVPALVWVSEYKALVFGTAGVMLAASGWAQWRSRYAACPVDLAQRQACLSARKTSAWIFRVSVGVYAAGGWFAFIQPLAP